MYPVSPIVEGVDLPETVYAKDQPQYKSFPVYKSLDGELLSRWKLSYMERLRILFTGNIYMWISTFNKPLQPVLLQTEKPEMES